jgi:hypothetical protein
MPSKLAISVSGVPDGSYMTVIVDPTDTTLAPLFAASIGYVSGIANTGNISPDTGTALTGFAIDNLATPVNGAVITGVTTESDITPVTGGMTLTASWVTRGTAYTELSNAQSASVRVDATIANTDSGILMEAGASGVGLVLYVYSGVLYFQCGNGGSFGTSAGTSETSYTLPAGTITPIIEWSADTSNAVLYIDGVEVDSEPFSSSAIAGGNAGTVGEVEDDCAVNRGGWTSEGDGSYANSITRCDIFLNQVTPDV